MKATEDGKGMGRDTMVCGDPKSFFEERNKEGFVLLLFKKKRTEENSTFPKPLSTYKGDVNSGLQRPQTFAGFGIAGRRDGGLSADAERREVYGNSLDELRNREWWLR